MFERVNLESGLSFKLSRIAPEGSKFGAWPYSLEYSYCALDFFGLATFGSNLKIDATNDVAAEILALEAMEKLKSEFGSKSEKVLKASKVFTREFEVGQKYKVKFEAPGLIHSGIYFESFADIFSFFSEMSLYTLKEVKALVFHSTTGDLLKTYSIFKTDSKNTISEEDENV